MWTIAPGYEESRSTTHGYAAYLIERCPMTDLSLKKSGRRSEDHYDVVADGAVVGRIKERSPKFTSEVLRSRDAARTTFPTCAATKSTLPPNISNGVTARSIRWPLVSCTLALPLSRRKRHSLSSRHRFRDEPTKTKHLLCPGSSRF